ncbi:bifunctional DNA-formamidopyrimidine glycosylase/DNA-(apurinic or apyrimidinic site) lyase [Spongisporangium articulatum]|uniref:Formamidopyrimidine-DNA glycosylase n=1 Tax=Spongisporangium articulatum TaxID=3362603 RepID=A0ABW8AN47_9ACTN
MPELPEVEVVRAGLARWVLDTEISAVEVHHPRPVRNHAAGPDDFVARLLGVRILDAVRRGKFLWLTLDSGEALLAHLGMSGQLVLVPPDSEPERHLRVRLGLAGGVPEREGRELRFVDQRMFGGLSVVPLVPTPDGGPGGASERAPEPLVPQPVAHIARDALDPSLDEEALVARLRRRRTGLKRALLDQGLVSGVGNIYADEALWRARLHYARPTETLTRPVVRSVLAECRAVMGDALRAGGTSFDSLYVDVNGSAGYFERSLAVYGRAGLPCLRCGTPVVREQFMNRSSHFCPTCQKRPRNARW